MSVSVKFHFKLITENNSAILKWDNNLKSEFLNSRYLWNIERMYIKLEILEKNKIKSIKTFIVKGIIQRYKYTKLSHRECIVSDNSVV